MSDSLICLRMSPVPEGLQPQLVAPLVLEESVMKNGARKKKQNADSGKN